jgi:hypothetical protein
MNIEFVEREQFTTRSAFTNQTLIPIYMLKDGVEYFVQNLPIVGGSYSPDYHLRESESYKAQLLANGGRYFKFYGRYENPEDMIAEMLEHKHTFVDPDDLFYVDEGSGSSRTSTAIETSIQHRSSTEFMTVS